MNTVKQILVAIDRSAMATEALKRAIFIANEKDAQLFIIHVIEPSLIESPFVQSIDENEIKKVLREQIDQLNAESKLKYILFVESGSAAPAITLKAQKTKADLLIVGTHGKDDISSNYFGSTTLKLIQNTHIPVLIVKNEAKSIYKKMLAPTNLTDYSKESILFANALFSASTRKYFYAFETVDALDALVYRISIEQQEKFRNELLSDAKTALGKFVKEVGEGEMALIAYRASINEDLLAYIIKDKADLLVLGSKGVNNLNSFVFGSTASYLVQRSPIDVLVYVPTTKKTKSEEKSTQKEAKPSTSPIQEDLIRRKDEIRDDFESFFQKNLKITNWNVPEAEDQKISEILVAILEEKLSEIKQNVKNGKYKEKRTDPWR